VLLQCFFEALLRRSGIDRGRKEADADGESAIALERDSGGAQQKIARHLGHDADAVAALAIGGHRAAMREAAQRSQRMAEDLVRRLIGDTRDKAHAAGIMVEARI
jgi:hypothetical protein